ncbi:S-layer homology domain-containing protein [Dialister invisus]|uniref:S-layer homology domain-containing protein n=1 Tax=Dialister invisus TaxID=218538 RepID=UPI003FD742FA
MNQVHKVIWSRVKNCYIVVSEITKRVGRDNKASVTGIRPLRALLCAMVIAGCMLPADADAANGLIHAGTGATASGDSSIAYGYSAEAKKEHSIAQGTKAKAEEEYALAMGYQANAKGLQSLAVGKGAIAKGNNSIAEGAGAKGYAKDGVAIGNNAESGTADNKDPRIPTIESNNGVAVGNSAKASGGSSVSVGNDSIGNGPSSVAIGNAATANDVRTTAIGNNAHAEGAGSLSIGREASALTLENATSTNPLVTGTDEQLDKKGVMAIGDDAKASGNNSIALGTSAKAGDLEKTRNSDSVTLTGSAKRITKLTSTRAVNNAVAIGTESSVQSDEDIAVGYRATTVASKYHQLPGSGQVAIGSNSNTYGSRGDVAIGSGAETNIRVKNVDHTNGPTEKRDAQSVAIGSVAKAYGSQAVAVGADTRAIGNSSVAIGTDDIELDRTKLETLLPGLANNENLNNKAPNDTTLGSAALGDKPYYVKTASIGTASVALGAMSQAAGDASMAMGLNALAEGDASTAIGPLARSKGKNSIAMGVSAQAAGGKGNTAIGHKAKVESAAGDGNIAFGSSASVKDGAGHVVIGKNASANTVNGYGIAIGSSASIGIGAAADAAAIGTGSRVEGSGIAFGRQAQVTASSTESGIAIGTESSVDGAQKGTAIGYKAKVLRSGDDSGLAIGTESSAGGNEGSIALGKKASVDSSTNAGGVAIGLNASAKGISSIVIGKDAKADDGNQAHVIAIGVGATATGTSQYSSVMGSAAKASREYSTVLGSNANSEVDGGVALGANSISNRHAGGSATGDVRTTNPYIPAGAGAAQVNAIMRQKGTTGAVSVGSDTVKRQIINVAAGTDDSDAVNVAQLKAVTSNASWTVQGNGSDVNAVKNGSKVNFADGTNTTASVTKDASGKVTAVKYNLKKDVNLGTDGSLTINGNTYINKDGINAGNKQITNVASGGDVVTNAANIGDINRIVTAKDKYITKGKATYQTNGDGTATLTGTNGLSANVTGLKNNYVTSGSVSNDGKTLTLERNDTGKVNVDLSKIFTEVAKEDYHLVANPEAGSQGKYKADSSGNMVLTVANEKGEKKQVTLTDIASKAQQNTNTTNITNINNTIAKGLNFKGDDATVINKKLGEQMDIKGGADASKLTDGNIGVVSGNGALNVKLAKDVTGLNSVTAGTARMGVDSADHKSYVTGLDNRDWDVQNPVVVNGRAATEDQLKKVSDAISTTTAAKTDFRLVKNPDAADGNYSVANGKVDLKVEDKAHPTTPASTVTINNIASASDVEKLKAGFKVKAGTNEGAIKAGETLEFAAKDNAGVEYDPAARKLTVSVSKDPTFNSVTVGDVKINNTGINAGNKQITNVASGGDVVTNAANIGDINRIVEAKDKYVTGGTADYQTNGDGTAALTGTNNLTANITGLKNNYVTSGSVSNDGKTLTLERNDTGKVNVDLSKIFTEVAKEDYHLVANPEAGSQGKYKADSSGNMVLTVANEKGEKKQVTLTDIASKAQQNTNTTNITNINKTIEKGLNFGGDSGADINKKLGEKLEIKGGASADLTDGNIGVISDGTKLNVKLKKDVDLGPNGSLTINGKTYVNKDGLNANSQKITNVADGTANSDAVNLGQLNAAIGGTAKATTVKAKDANVTVTEGTNPAGGKEYTVGLGDKVTLGTADKKIVVDGTSGKITAGSKVTIDGTTGDIQAGTVKVTGAGTVNELTNRTWDIDNPTVVHGQAATEDQLKTVSDGVKTNKTNITNINNTIGKGLNFGGDSGAVINKKLGEKLEIKGGASADLTDDNIGVVSDGTKLNVKLKKDVNLGPDGSLTINGKTYVNKDGLNANGQKITNVANGTVNSDAVNFGQLKDAVAAGKTILKDGKNTTVEGEGTVANPYKVNVNDDLVLGKKGADGKDGSIGVNGKDGSIGVNGKDGSIGLNGKDGANGLTIKGGDGKPGVDGTNITRLIIEEKDGKKHDVATLDDGMKYGGDTGAVIKKKLNEQVNVVGGITDESKLTTDDNIGVVSDGSNNLKVRLAKNINLGPDGSLTINGKTYVNKDGLNANGQKITNVADGTVNSDAVNFGQLKDAVAAGKTILKDGKNTTVEGEGTVANPYKVNVNDDLVLGKKGADGKDGSIGVNGKDGSSVVIHGKDGISIKGKDGKDGVTLKAKDGANGTEGQIGLTGPAGKDGKSTHADIGVNAGPASLDPAKNLSATEMTRLYYVDEKGDHQVATMDDGMKFAGNTGLAIKKLNSTMTIRGTGTKADTEYDPSNIKTMVDADGNMIVGLDKNLKADSVGINGKDGRDGATIKGGDGKPGVDGTNITRLIIEEKNGKQHDIATLDDGMKYGGDTGAVIKKKLNEQVNVVGGITDESKLTTDDNIGVVSDGSNNLKVRLAKDVKLNSVTAGNVVMDTTGFYVKKMTRTPAGTVSLTADGLNNGGNKIANIAAGEADTDAVNVSQLKNQGSEIVNKGFGIKAEDGNEVKKKLGETVDVVGDGKNISTRVEGGRVRVGLKDDILLNSVTTGRTRMDTNGLTVQDGSGNTAVTVDKDGLKIKDGPSVTKSGIDAGGKKITNVAAGEADTDAVNVSQLKKAAAGATTKVADGKNTTVTSETNADGSKTYRVNLNDDITLGTDPSKQISIKGSEGTIKAGQVTVNGTAGTVNGLTNKTWDPNNITSGQAATEDQLKVVSGQAGKHSSVTAGSNISVTTGTNANGGTEYKVAVVDTPTFKTVTTGNTVMSNSGLTIKNGPSITQTGVDAGGKRITNVAAGKADTDAVNVGQLKQIGGAINKVDNRINRVGAGAAALAALHPLDFDPDDKWDFTLGYGNYKDAHSLALGAFYRPNEDTMISVGGSIGGGENMVNAGLSMKLGQGNHVSTSKVAMAKEIKDLRAELENVKGALLKVADGRPLDSMDMDKMQLFPDVPENHWAYDYVATLAGNGVIVGYPDGQFGGDRMMTRYEMAALIYRAMQNGAAADDRMARALKEFEPELERIRVDTISKHKDGTPDIQRVRVIKGRG